MELPILLQLPLPEDARRIVLRFLRKPHPTALLINELIFTRRMQIECTRPYAERKAGHLLLVRGREGQLPYLNDWKNYKMVPHYLTWTTRKQDLDKGVTFLTDPVTGKLIRKGLGRYFDSWDWDIEPELFVNDVPA